MASNQYALVVPNGDLNRFGPVLIWLTTMMREQDGSKPPKVHLHCVLDSILRVTGGSVESLTYGRMASIDTGKFVAFVNTLAGANVPREFSQGLEGFFKVWDQALK